MSPRPLLPSVDRLLRLPRMEDAASRFGHTAAAAALREELARAREIWRKNGAGESSLMSSDQLAQAALSRLEEEFRLSQRPVFNLTGVVLHTNLGRALLAEAAIEAIICAMRRPTNLEFELETGGRGKRDDHVRGLLCRITGAEDATAVNNNAAAVMLALNTLANGREAIISRGELIEIGGSFRMPDIMERSGCRLREVGTTNRTHLKDYAAAIGPETGLILRVHTSNYVVQGFTKSVPGAELAKLARDQHIPLVNDLGSGTLADLRAYGLSHEPTVTEAVNEGADLVTFSGDKLLGGPQAGLIVGRKDLIAQLNRNPIKRALRLDKLRLAALEATLKLYLDPDSLPRRLPALRLMLRRPEELRPLAITVRDSLAALLGDTWQVEIVDCKSETGSGALPLATLPSLGVAARPRAKRTGGVLEALTKELRRLPVPVIGRIEAGALILDLRCLEEQDAFLAQLPLIRAENLAAPERA